MHDVISIFRDPVQIILFYENIIAVAVGKGSLIAQRCRDTRKPLYSIIGIEIAFAVRLSLFRYLSVGIYGIERNVPQCIGDAGDYIMPVIGVFLHGSHGRGRCDHTVQFVITIGRGLSQRIGNAGQIACRIIRIAFRQPFRCGNGSQTTQGIIGIGSRASVAVPVCSQPVQSVIGVICGHTVAVL